MKDFSCIMIPEQARRMNKNLSTDRRFSRIREKTRPLLESETKLEGERLRAKYKK